MKKHSRRLISCLTAASMVYSSSAFAAISPQRKAQINNLVNEFSKSNFSTLYSNYGTILDSPSRGIFEIWLEKFGKQKVDSIRIEPLKGKKQDAFNILMTMNGTTMSLIIDEADREHVVINGEKFAIWEIMSFRELATRLAKKDKKFAGMALVSETGPTPVNFRARQAEALAGLPAQKKGEYLVLLRLARESAEKVYNSYYDLADNNKPTPSFTLHPLLQSILAEANSLKVSKVKPPLGSKCGNAGGLYVYENGSYGDNQKGIFCNSHTSNPDAHRSVSYHAFCQNTQKEINGIQGLSGVPVASMTACDPLLYGGWDDGSGGTWPYCQNNRSKSYTQEATRNCSKMSPLRGDSPDHPDRIADTKKLVESLAKLKGNDASVIAKCFNDAGRVATQEECTKIFEPLVKETNDYIDKALEEVCTPSSLKQKTEDQRNYCDELNKRRLSLEYFAKVTFEMPPDQDIAACKEAGGSLITEKGADIRKQGEQGLKSCVCSDPNHVTQKRLDGNYSKCGAPVVDAAPAKPGEKDCFEPKDKTKKECQSGVAGWLGKYWPLLAIPPLLIWLFRSRGSSTTTVTPPYPFPQWLTEGNNGQTGGTGAGGSVRGSQPQPRPTLPPGGFGGSGAR